ncbi:MAG: hypothetical protein N2450_05035, partial [bacterium]|nr:hypothetical protein [bacterium]
YGSEKYQVVLHNNGNIDFKYGPRTSTSSSTATIGIQGSQSGTQFTQYGDNAMSWPGENFAIRYTTQPPTPPQPPNAPPWANIYINYSYQHGSTIIDHVILEWGAVEGNINGYKIYASTGAYDSPNPSRLVPTVPAGTTTVTLTGNIPTSLQYYRITAYRDGNSTDSYGVPWQSRPLGINRDPVKVRD